MSQDSNIVTLVVAQDTPKYSLLGADGAFPEADEPVFGVAVSDAAEGQACAVRVSGIGFVRFDGDVDPGDELEPGESTGNGTGVAVEHDAGLPFGRALEKMDTDSDGAAFLKVLLFAAPLPDAGGD
jgi:hypothetical protein